MPKKTMYPCQYPECTARYDETLDGKIEGTGALLTGWVFPWDAESTAVEESVRTHEHILNIMHKVEVDTDIHDMDDYETGCIGLTTEPGSPQPSTEEQ
jgi:hypothetical protein